MRWKFWLNIVTFLALGFIIFLARHDIARAFAYIDHLNVFVLLLMVPAQFFVYFALAKLFQYFFKAAHTDISAWKLLPAMLELNFVNHIFPSGGVSGFSYLTLRLKSYGISTAKSTLAQIARFAITFVLFIGLMLVALLVLAAEGRTSSLVVLAVSAMTFSILFGSTVLLYVIGSERRIAVFTRTLARWLNRCIHMVRRKHPETISLKRVEQTFLELHTDYCLIRGSKQAMRRVFGWALLINVAELSVLYIAFLAHGEWVNPGAIIIAFVIANFAGFIAILPGGIGLYEPLMTAVLISAGVPASLALSATLVYRVIALLLSLISGYILYQRAIHRYGRGLSGQRPH